MNCVCEGWACRSDVWDKEITQRSIHLPHAQTPQSAPQMVPQLCNESHLRDPALSDTLLIPPTTRDIRKEKKLDQASGNFNELKNAKYTHTAESPPTPNPAHKTPPMLKEMSRSAEYLSEQRKAQ